MNKIIAEWILIISGLLIVLPLLYGTFISTDKMTNAFSSILLGMIGACLFLYVIIWALGELNKK